MAQQTISHADTFKAGDAKGPLLSDGARGSFVNFPTVEAILTPGAVMTSAVCASQAVAAAGNALINSADVTTGTVTAGVWTAIACRNLTAVSSNVGDTTQTLTVYGTDANDNLQGEIITLNGTTAVAGVKTFKRVYRIAVSAALVGNLIVGSGLILGLKMRCATINTLIVTPRIITEGGVVTVGTFSGGTTTTQTATNADNRARYTPASYAGAINVMYFPDLTKEGVGTGMLTLPGPNFVHADQGFSNGAP